MSVTLTLVPLAIAVGITLTATSAVVLSEQKHTPAQQQIPPLETAFTDANLLHKTLTQHGLQVHTTHENELTVSSPSGVLRYYRQNRNQPYMLQISHVSNMRELLDSVDELTNEYGRNVQTFTYNKVMTSLHEHGMTVDQEEVLEDDSILLTLNV